MNRVVIILILLSSFVNAMAQKKSVQSPNNSSIIEDPVEPGPSFPGGQKAWGKFLTENLKWPDPVIDAQGKVYIGFIVESDGRLTNIKIIRGIVAPFDNEALRVIKKSPKWKPKIINGIPVRSGYTVPISFVLSE